MICTVISYTYLPDSLWLNYQNYLLLVFSCRHFFLLNLQAWFCFIWATGNREKIVWTYDTKGSYIRTCRINPQCRSMPINKDQISGIDPQHGSIKINPDQLRSILLSKDQCRTMLICIDLLRVKLHVLYWVKLTFIDRKWSTMIFIDPYLDQFLNSDLYWSLLDWSSMSCYI